MFDKVTDRASTRSSRWGGKDVLALTIGDTDFVIAAPIREAIQDRLDHGVLGYDTVPESLFEGFIERARKLYGWEIQRDWLIMLPNVLQGLNFSCRGLAGEDESVITETPIYYPFLEAPPNSNRAICKLPAIDSGSGWTFDLAGFEKLCARDDTRVFLLCHPQNPLGRVFTQETLAEISAIAARHNVVVCSDEIHADLLFDGARHIPFAATNPEAENNSLTLMAPTKAFSTSGLGGALAIIPNEDIRERFRQVSKGLIPNLNSFSLVAMQAAYEECDEWLSDQVSHLTENRNFLVKALTELGLTCHTPAATYFMWLGFEKTGLNNPFEAMLEAGVELTDGAKFDGAGFLRLNFASPRETLEEAVSRMAAKLA